VAAVEEPADELHGVRLEPLRDAPKELPAVGAEARCDVLDDASGLPDLVVLDGECGDEAHPERENAGERARGGRPPLPPQRTELHTRRSPASP